MTRGLLGSVLCVALALPGCGAESVPPDDARRHAQDDEPGDTNNEEDVAGRRPTATENRAIQRLLAVAEEMRSLSFLRPVPFRVQSREVITQFVRDQTDAEELERARVFYVALGLLPPDLDIHELLIRVLGEQIVGYYDPERSLMVIREDVAEALGRSSTRIGSSRELGEAEMVIVHELVHALQDQRLGLGQRYEEERTIDAENAFASVVEGDATLAMIGHLAHQNHRTLAQLTANPALLRMLIESNPSGLSGQEIDGAPAIVRVPLISRYIDGLLYCATLHGASSWAGVDAAHRANPTSTEQILHPERYLSGEQPDEILLPAFESVEAAGFEPFEEETLGELEMSLFFGLAVEEERNESAAEGWGGDRLRVYRGQGDTLAVVWFTSWDDEGEAAEAEAAFRAVEAARTTPGTVVRRGRAVLVIRGVADAAAISVRSAFETMADGLPESPPSTPRRRNQPRTPENRTLDGADAQG